MRLTKLRAAIEEIAENNEAEFAGQLRDAIKDEMTIVRTYEYYTGRTTRRRNNEIVEGADRNVYDTGKLFKSIRVDSDNNVVSDLDYAVERLHETTNLLINVVDTFQFKPKETL